ncbi:MAG: lipoyl protein ligase domain-containing protein [Sulfuriferula sp.]
MIRILDSGLQSGLANNAIDRYYLGLHAQGACADRLRFYRSLPSASIGCYQIIDRELRIDYCRDNNIVLVRRPSGGGAIYLDPQQLGWSLIVQRPPQLGLEQLLALFAVALADGLKCLGIDAHYKFPNDLEIDGRKIAALFIACETESVLLQGTLLLDADIRTMLEALRVPTEKFSPDGLAAARERLITVKEYLREIPALGTIQTVLTNSLAVALGRRFGDEANDFNANKLPCNALVDESVAAHQLDWRDEPIFALEALWKTPGGTLRARAGFSGDGKRLAWIEIGGDVHLEPGDWVRRLQLALEDLPVAYLQQRITHFFHTNPADMLGFATEDVTRLLQILLDKLSLHHTAHLSSRQLNALMIYSPSGAGTEKILSEASVMLVPYCAKPVWCKWRLRDGCPECGLCEVGEAYRLARERNMQVTTITNYEHLVTTLADMKAREVPAYIGMCCSSFFIKRHRAFQQAGMPALLMDISGANCYELKQEEQAYAGQFQAQAHLDTALLQQVIEFVPRADKNVR